MQSDLADQVLAPGPVNLHPRVREIMAAPMIHHRTPEFDTILHSTLAKLPEIFQTKEQCFLLTSTGSGGMEAALINTLRPGDHVLAIVSGKFGERWRDMARAFGAYVTELSVPWGEAADPDQVQRTLKANPKIALVLCQACETSTAVRHPIKELSKVIRENCAALFLVDAITALGAYSLPMDEWQIDAVVGGSQKAFMLPTGLSLLAFSRRAWDVIEKNPTPRFYFDIRQERKANERGETWFSSNVPLVRALDVVTDLMLKPSLNDFFATIEKRAMFVRRFFLRLGFEIYARSPSPSVTALRFRNEKIDSQKVRARLEEKFRVTVMGGQEQLKGKILRVGHMGYIQPQVMIDLFFQLRDVLAEFGLRETFNEVQTRQEMETFWQNP